MNDPRPAVARRERAEPAGVGGGVRRAGPTGPLDGLAQRRRRLVAEAVAAALSTGDWDVESMTARAEAAVRPPGRWCAEVARAARQAYPRPPLHHRELTRFLLAYPALPRAFAVARERGTAVPEPVAAPLEPNRMRGPRWDVPMWSTSADVAAHLGLTLRELDWFADVTGWAVRARADGVRHYRYRWAAKAAGGVRLIESPKWQLRELQRRLIREVFDRIPPHDAAHGFRRGRSVLSHTAEHVGQRFVLRMDIENFFAAIAAGRVWGLLRLAGYPEPVAHTLTGLLTTAAPSAVRDRLRQSPDAAQRRLGEWLATPHLPTGAPTSPAAANLVAYGLDRRLARLAETAGLRYTRYADDLAFSGGAGFVNIGRFAELVARIAGDEGFRVNDRKTCVMGAGGRQRLTGVVVNQRPNVSREDFDRLKATLHNAVVAGPVSQNRGRHPDFRAHLLGRIAWVGAVNPARGARLHRIYDQIDWTTVAGPQNGRPCADQSVDPGSDQSGKPHGAID